MRSQTTAPLEPILKVTVSSLCHIEIFFGHTDTELADNTPYIVSEVSSSAYDAVDPRVFYVGDENKTNVKNDFPKLYKNGPLQESTNYSVFLWAFVHFIPPSSVSVCICVGMYDCIPHAGGRCV